MRPTQKQPMILSILFLLACLVLPLNHGVASENPQITDGSKVTFLYVITIPGNIGMAVRDVGEFVQGQHQILPSLEREMTGMKPGEEKRVELSAEQGFGAYDAKKMQEVRRAELPDGVKQGDILKDKEGRPAIVKEMSDSSAVIDYNHPLAGQALFVQIKILKVENPS